MESTKKHQEKWESHYSTRRRRMTYPEGVVTHCITISREADERLQENHIINVSSYINDVILWSLNGGQYLKHQVISKFNEIQKEMESIGYEVSIQKKIESDNNPVGS
jgi:hypothetical protein